MFNSEKYWKNRYNQNGNSGSGSYGRLCNFKNKILNDFVKNHNIQSIIELGCGDGNQLINSYYPKYIGYDISDKAIDLCRTKIKHNNYEFIVIHPETKFQISDLAISLDVLFHLTEEEQYREYINNLFNSSDKWVIIYSCDMDQKEFDNKYKIKIVEWMYLRKFTEYISKNFPEWQLVEIIKNEYPYSPKNPTNTSLSDFYIYQKKN